jgi:hypothetical protein
MTAPAAQPGIGHCMSDTKGGQRLMPEEVFAFPSLLTKLRKLRILHS